MKLQEFGVFFLFVFFLFFFSLSCKINSAGLYIFFAFDLLSVKVLKLISYQSACRQEIIKSVLFFLLNLSRFVLVYANLIF